MTVPAALKFTYEDYCLLPEDRRYEVIDGDLFLTPSPALRHQDVVLRLARLLADFVEVRKLGRLFVAPCDVVLSKVDVVQPDILFVSAGRQGILAENYVAGAPDLVIEILSPSTESRDRIAKAKRYATFGVREMWLVDPTANTIEVLVNSEEGFRREALYEEADTVNSVCLPELEFAPGSLFRPI